MNHPIIIIEGQDRCSKSTTANQLAHRFGPGTIKTHSSSPPKELAYPYNLIWEENNYFSLMHVFNRIAETNSIVADRFHLGCPVFGKRFRKYREDLHIDRLEKYMQLGDNVFLILLTDYGDVLFDRDDGKSYEKSAFDFDETAYEFITEFNRSLIPHKLHINITENGGFSNTFQTVIDFIESEK